MSRSSCPTQNRMNVAFFILSACFLLVMCSWNRCAHAEAETSAVTPAPSRIIVFPLYAEEILLDLVEPDRIVYVGHQNIDEDGNAYSPTMHLTQGIPGSTWQNCGEEYLVDLNPDLIILDSDLFRDYQAIFPSLAQTNATFLFLDTPTSFDEIKSTILRLGQVVGHEAKAQRLVEKFDAELSVIGDLVQQIPMEKRARVVYYEAYASPLLPVIAQAAGVILFPPDEVSDASIARWNPDMICFCPYGLDTDGSLYVTGDEYVASCYSQIITNPVLCNVKAVQAKRIFPLSIYESQYAALSVKTLFAIAYPDMLSACSGILP